MGKILRALHRSRDTQLDNFFRKAKLPSEFYKELKEAAVTNHVVMFILALIKAPGIPNMQKWYDGYIEELESRGIVFQERSELWKPKQMLPPVASVTAIIIPKLLLNGDQVREIGLKIGMIPA